MQVTPWVRFPGSHLYTPGHGVRTVSAEGSITWQRVTRRKTYVYFRASVSNPNGHVSRVRSSRVIIPAR